MSKPLKNTLCFDLHDVHQFEDYALKKKLRIYHDYGFRLVNRLAIWDKAVYKMLESAECKLRAISWLLYKRGWKVEDDCLGISFIPTKPIFKNPPEAVGQICALLQELKEASVVVIPSPAKVEKILTFSNPIRDRCTPKRICGLKDAIKSELSSRNPSMFEGVKGFRKKTLKDLKTTKELINYMRGK